MAGVERASRYERVRRMAWMFGSLFIAGGVVLLAAEAARALAYSDRLALVAVAVMATGILVFRWGVERFDLVPPKEVREAETDA